jgi:putative Holliday junction resolvase
MQNERRLPEAAAFCSSGFCIHHSAFDLRTLAVDLGSRRVGLALSDEGGRFATPFDVLQVTSPAQAAAAVAAVAAREGVERIVVGLPLNMDDSFGDAARNTVAWARFLSAAAGKPLVFVDERLSSFEAGQQLAERRRGGERLTHAGKRQRLDALAAAGFLQDFLDGRLPAIEVDDAL